MYCEACWKAFPCPLPPDPITETCPQCGGPMTVTAQVPFFRSDAAYPAFFSAAGCGKTMIGAHKHLKFIMESGVDGLVYAQTWDTHLEQGTLKAYLAIWESYPSWCKAGLYNKTERRLPIRCQNGKEAAAVFRPIGDENLLNMSFGSAHLDEACLDGVAREDFNYADDRLRSPLPPGMRHQHILTGTPKKLDHWTYEDYGSPDREDVKYEEFLTAGYPPVRARAMAQQWKESRPWWHMYRWENIYIARERMEEWRRRYEGSTTAQARQEWYGEWAAEGEGRIFEPSWFKRYDAFPDNIAFAFDSWDTAHTAKDWSTYTVSQTWLIAKTDEGWGYYLVNMDRVKLNYGDVKLAIEGRQKHSGARFSLIEDRGSGQMALQELAAKGVRVRPFKVGNKDKFERANTAAIPAQEGRVYLPSQAFAERKGMNWLNAFEREVFQCPHTKYWDVVDCYSQSIIWAEQWRWDKILNKPAPRVRTIVGDERRERLAV